MSSITLAIIERFTRKPTISCSHHHIQLGTELMFAIRELTPNPVWLRSIGIEAASLTEQVTSPIKQIVQSSFLKYNSVWNRLIIANE